MPHSFSGKGKPRLKVDRSMLDERLPRAALLYYYDDIKNEGAAAAATGAAHTP
ncbi:MAG: hypothetical protein JOY74_09775 [Sinobacteraceae bacterium]|nr:hypothetical protein [Nevskiaceae bacterium]MBV9724502.1 hypothetical protein [Gammaproteobacteria bacterium]